MMLVAGPVCNTDPADKRKPDHQHKNHKQILLSASSEGPGNPRAFPLEALVLLTRTRSITLYGKLTVSGAARGILTDLF
jgi:hypothetical protein